MLNELEANYRSFQMNIIKKQVFDGIVYVPDEPVASFDFVSPSPFKSSNASAFADRPSRDTSAEELAAAIQREMMGMSKREPK
ncbi:hypothetical protein M9Y10_007243 [Tritrichomonas musculus]|uniref:Uncharacterized protein n=1 Tax=Tritrichomonas musculus TaxID=1915356 RepID=A0ABR2J1T6_9EUKA